MRNLCGKTWSVPYYFLSANGLHHGKAETHQSHFHVDLRAPKRVTIDSPQNMLADNPDSNQTAPVASDDLLANAQSLLDQVKADLNLTQGEVTMFIPDMPNVPPQNVPVLIAQANQAQPGDVKTTRTLGVCQIIPNAANAIPSLENVMSPNVSAKDYFYWYEQKKIITSPATITILQQPKHGILRLVTEDDRGTLFSKTSGALKSDAGLYAYLPEKGYLGKDSATALVEIGGIKVKVAYFFQTVDSGSVGEGLEERLCENGTHWKISTTLYPNGNGNSTSTLTSVDYQSATTSDTTSTDTAALASTLGSSILSGFAVDTSSVTLNFADLPGGAVGQTVGANITLDDNAAGNNWFIDTTPGSNEEFLPTSNPYEWVAKAGSAAYGKMDMLSVLLHEYGHALGIEHSADNHDYMATTLTPGVRRMPSASELALMQELIGVAKGEMVANASTPTPTLPLQGGGGLPIPLGAGFGLAFLGRMRKGSYGGTSIDVVGAPTITHYAVAANATFTNLATPAGWNSQGSVDIAPSTIDPSTGSGRTASVTLNEISTSQTRLSQVFMLNEQDRYLSFTLSGTALDNLTGAPDDAFEVALLDANTGLSVLGSDGLTRTDAFLNLQGDGTEHAASSVTRIDNADGSRTYRVDLTGVAKNKAVNLSFDLLGFGQDNSHVSLRDIRVSGLPQLRDDVAIIAEDNLLTFDPFAQADAQLKPLLASHIVGAPTHGALAVNADGTFSYTPDLDYFGTDSFSYRLSDGPLDSNLATVSLTVTPVNDAPVAADVAMTTAEDTPLVIALGAYASDVDSTNITTQVVTGPAHGVLVQNNDGTYSYTPDANYNGADSFTYKVNDGELDSNSATVNLTITAMNDAPVAVDTQAVGFEDTPLNLNLLAAASDVDGDVLTPAIIAGPLHGQLVSNPDGTFNYVSNLNYFGTDSFTYKVNDGPSTGSGLDSNIVTVSLTIAAVNDAPVAVSAAVTGKEDTPYIFGWSDFKVSDVDSLDTSTGLSTGLAITFDTLPMNGLLQQYDGLNWTAVVIGQRVNKADIDAGNLCFGPDANQSGFSGYTAAGPSTGLGTGFGNLKSSYASFTYHADDGFLNSAMASMTIAITPVADAPSLMLTTAADAYGTTATRFHTSWETVANKNTNSTVLPQNELEGWRAFTAPLPQAGEGANDAQGATQTLYDTNNHFIVWSSGDMMKDANRMKNAGCANSRHFLLSAMLRNTAEPKRNSANAWKIVAALRCRRFRRDGTSLPDLLPSVPWLLWSVARSR